MFTLPRCVEPVDRLDGPRTLDVVSRREEELESQRVLKLLVVADFGEGNRNKNVRL